MNKTRFLAFLVMLAGCVGSTHPPVIRIATDATFAPFHHINEQGEPTGFDVELARTVVIDAGFTPEIIVLPYDELFSGLLDGSHDLVAATTGITAERQKIYRFSRPYFETCQVAVVRTGAPEPQRIADLVGLKIGASGQGTSARAMNSINGDPVSITEGESISMLLDRSIDAWIVDEFDAVAVVQNSSRGLRVLRQGIATEQYGLVFAGDNRILQERLDESLNRIFDNGTIENLLRAHGVQREAGWPVTCIE